MGGFFSNMWSKVFKSNKSFGASKHIYKSYDNLESHIFNDHKTYQNIQTKDKKPSNKVYSFYQDVS